MSVCVNGFKKLAASLSRIKHMDGRQANEISRSLIGLHHDIANSACVAVLLHGRFWAVDNDGQAVAVEGEIICKQYGHHSGVCFYGILPILVGETHFAKSPIDLEENSHIKDALLNAYVASDCGDFTICGNR